MERRDFFKKAAVVAGAAAIGVQTAQAGTTKQPIDDQKIAEVAFPEKRPLIMYSDRPPLLKRLEGFSPLLSLPMISFLYVGTCRIFLPISIRLHTHSY